MFPIIEKLGGRKKTTEHMNAVSDRQYSYDTLRMWDSRGSMPGHAMRILMQIAERDGIDYTVNDFNFIDEKIPRAVQNGHSNEAKRLE